MAGYPLIPTLDPIRSDETPYGFGLRAFRFLVSEHLTAGLLDSPTLELALSASQSAVTSVDMLDETRETLQMVRLDILKTIERRRKEIPLIDPIAIPTDAKPLSGGKPELITRPKPIVPSPSVALDLKF